MRGWRKWSAFFRNFWPGLINTACESTFSMGTGPGQAYKPKRKCPGKHSVITPEERDQIEKEMDNVVEEVDEAYEEVVDEIETAEEEMLEIEEKYFDYGGATSEATSMQSPVTGIKAFFNDLWQTIRKFFKRAYEWLGESLGFTAEKDPDGNKAAKIHRVKRQLPPERKTNLTYNDYSWFHFGTGSLVMTVAISVLMFMAAGYCFLHCGFCQCNPLHDIVDKWRGNSRGSGAAYNDSLEMHTSQRIVRNVTSEAANEEEKRVEVPIPDEEPTKNKQDQLRSLLQSP